MKISIISASHRMNSQSKRISDLLHNNLLNINSGLEIFSLDLADASLPFWSPDKKNGKGISYNYYASRYDYLRISIAMLEDWNNNTCEGQYLKSLYENRIDKWSEELGKERNIMETTNSYNGQFYSDINGIDRPIFVMDGFGGQSHVIDFEKNRVISMLAVHRDYDVKLTHLKKLKQQ